MSWNDDDLENLVEWCCQGLNSIFCPDNKKEGFKNNVRKALTTGNMMELYKEFYYESNVHTWEHVNLVETWNMTHVYTDICMKVRCILHKVED